MRLVHTDEISDMRIVRSLGYSPVGAVVLFALIAAAPIVAYLAYDNFLSDLHWVVWIVVGPVASIFGLLWIVLLSAAWTSVEGTLRRTNWVMKVAGDGVFLQFRSYANFHFPDTGATAVFLGFDEIASVRRIVDRKSSLGRETERVSYKLEMRLRHGDTEVLRAAIRAETEVDPPLRRFLFFTTSMRCLDRQVEVVAADLLRIAWTSSRMLRELEPHVEIGAADGDPSPPVAEQADPLPT